MELLINYFGCQQSLCTNCEYLQICPLHAEIDRLQAKASDMAIAYNMAATERNEFEVALQSIATPDDTLAPPAHSGRAARKIAKDALSASQKRNL